MRDTADRPASGFAPRYAWHLGTLMRLAWPVMLSRAGILTMAFCDIAMLGRYQEGAVGIATLGLAVFVPAMVMTIGFVTGLVPVVATAYGAGQWRECGFAWRRGMVWGAVLSVIAAWVTWQSEWILALTGQTPDLAAAGGDVARALAPGLVAQVLFAVSAFYLEATGRPSRALYAMILANIVNAILNWVLIWGMLGAPEMGAVGAALASTVARIGAMAAMIAFVLFQDRPEEAGVRGPSDTFWGPGGWRAGAPMRRLGASAGVGNGLETAGFSAMTLFAGMLGTAALDAYAISHNLVSVLFMVGLGLSIATGVRVGHERGRRRPGEAAFAGWTGLSGAALVLGAAGVGVYLGRDWLPLVYTDDPETQARTSALLAVSAFILVFDSAQVVMGQAVRALGDALVAVLIYSFAFVILMVPLGWVVVMVWGFDERGLVVTIGIACAVATLLLAWRFAVLTAREREAPGSAP